MKTSLLFITGSILFGIGVKNQISILMGLGLFMLVISIVYELIIAEMSIKN